MPRYELNRLGPQEFENLIQALIKAIIGDGTITFGAGPDGGREATYRGTAPYPSESAGWTGNWLFQAKFHDIALSGLDKARKVVIQDLNAELDKVVNKLQRPVDNYIFATNVPLSPKHESGTLDLLMEVAAQYTPRITNFSIWGGDDINRFLDKHVSVRTSYLHFITPGDLIAALLSNLEEAKSELGITIRSYIETTYNREQYAQLDQAGDVADKPVKLPKIFVEVHARPEIRRLRDEERGRNPTLLKVAHFLRREQGTYAAEPARMPVVRFFLSEEQLRIVLVGGPGEGKSTVGQYLSQLHRAQILGKIDDVANSSAYYPLVPRIPIRVILRDFGQWITEVSEDNGRREGGHTLEEYICHDIKQVSSRTIAPEGLHSIVRSNPTLLILDGLDEVTDPLLKNTVIERANDFIRRLQSVMKADLQVLATTRPTGYSQQFNPDAFVHLVLQDLEPDEIRSYVKKWSVARELDHGKSSRLERGIEECLKDRQVKLLMKSPLQVTILVLIISAGGTPPRQREALFNEYLDVIYKREQGKGSGIITTNRELLVGLHKFIGYELQERATQASATDATLSAADYSDLVAQFIKWNDPYSSARDREKQLKSITVEAGERLVLIVESSADRFGFELRSLQEFFAACHLVDTSVQTTQRYRRFDAIVGLPHWRNVALFFGGRVGRNFQGEAANVVEVCKTVDRDGVDTELRRGSSMALAIAYDRALLPNRRLQHSLLEVALEILDSKPPARGLEAIYDRLEEMPREDIADHVIPILEKKLKTLAPDRLQPVVQVTCRIDPENRALTPAIARMLSNAATMKDAFPLALDAAEVIGDLIPSLSRVVGLLSDPELATVFDQAEDMGQLKRWAKTLDSAGASRRVLDLIIRSGCGERGRMVAASLRSKTPVWEREEAPEEVGVGLVLQAAETIFNLQRYPDRPRMGFPEGVLEVIDAVRDRVHESIINGKPRKFAERVHIQPTSALMAPFWVLHLLTGDVTATTYNQALKFFTRNSDDAVVDVALQFPVIYGVLFPSIYARLGTQSIAQLPSDMRSWAGRLGVQRWITFASAVQTNFVHADRQGAQISVCLGDVASQVSREYSHIFSRVNLEKIVVEDVNYGFYVDQAIGGRIGKSGASPILGDWRTQIKLAFGDPHLTSSRIFAILRLSRLRSSAALDASEVRGTILRRALAIDETNDVDLVVRSFLACCDVGLMSERVLRKVAQRFGRSNSTPLRLLSSDSEALNTFCEAALNIANDVKSSNSILRRGCCRLILSGGLRSMYFYPDVRTLRYKGFANSHRQLGLQRDIDSRLACIVLFWLRSTWSDEDFRIVKDLILRCDDDFEAHVLSRLIASGVQEESRVDSWRQLLTELLTERLHEALETEVRQGLEVTLEKIDQSLQHMHVDLGLPLASV